jgi:hypothetical protein
MSLFGLVGGGTTRSSETFEIDKLINSERAAAKDGDAAMVANNVQADLQVKLNKTNAETIGGDSSSSDSSDTPTDNDTPSDDGDAISSDGDDLSGDNLDLDVPSEEVPADDAEDKDKKKEEEEPAPEENAETKEDKPADTTEATPSEESRRLRQVTFSNESLDDAWEFASNQSRKVAEMLGSSVMYLGHFGIKAGMWILQKMYKGLLILISRTAKMLYEGSIELGKYLDRKVYSFESYKKDLLELKKSVELVQKNATPLDPSDELFRNRKVIDGLKISDSVDFAANVAVLSKFVKSEMSDLGKAISRDNALTRRIMESPFGKERDNARAILTVPVPGNGFHDGFIQGYENDFQFNDTYHSDTVLPSDARMLVVLPKKGLKTYPQVAEAYNKSAIFLGLDIRSYEEVTEVPFLPAEKILLLIGSLVELCDICLAHEVLFRQILKDKEGMANIFRVYFNRLVNSEDKVSIEDSMVECIHLKSMFSDKVYLSGAMDLHDFSRKILSFGLTFLKTNTSKLV